MTKEEILKIKEHIEIHARREPRAVYITQIMWKAVEELEHIAELEKENAELKSELKNWKDEWQEQVQKAIDEGYARTQQTIQLTKAKELIEDLYDRIPASHSDYYEDVMERARQFIKEIEKC